MLDQLGIEKVTIDLPFRLNHVNCFLAEGKDGYLIMDTGLNDKKAYTTWKEVIKDKQVNELIITHLHPDHVGFAGTLQNMTGAYVKMSELDAKSLKGIWTNEAIPELIKDYQESDVSQHLVDEIVTILRDFRPVVSPPPIITSYLQEGEKVQIGKEEYEVIFTPGHSEGLVCFYNKDKNVLFSTDHILPKITPNISYWFYGEKNPLKSYENSLNKIKQLNAEFVIPSHGDPFYHANERIDEIWNHHLDRFEVVLDSLRKPATVFDVCEAMFPKELSVYDYQFAIGEAIAHLEYLREKGECKREMQGGKWVYEKN